jgi:DNA (cytosine-5)-methyltransferase 1
MTRPRLLDLFCGAGGAATGYHRAGFDVTGVDIKRQPHYPFEFHQGDAMTYPLDGFDAIHASPPCHDHSAMSTATGPDGTGWMLDATRHRLLSCGLPWVLENTERVRLPDAWTLCGTQFGLPIRRHRKFEVHPPIFTLMPPCNCAGRVASGELVGHRLRGKVAPGRRQPPPRPESVRLTAYDVPWMTGREARQAIPPAYTEYIGRQLLAALAVTT